MKIPFYLFVLFFLLASCNPGNQQEKPRDKNSDSLAKQAPLPPPDTEPTGVTVTKSFPKKCFENAGLKYNVTINIIYLSDTTVTGTVSSQSLESNHEERADFTGTVNNNKLNVKFKGSVPVVGDASEWTNKPWVLKTANGAMILSIVFNAKDYNTNKWGEQVYEFNACK